MSIFFKIVQFPVGAESFCLFLHQDNLIKILSSFQEKTKKSSRVLKWIFPTQPNVEQKMFCVYTGQVLVSANFSEAIDVAALNQLCQQYLAVHFPSSPTQTCSNIPNLIDLITDWLCSMLKKKHPIRNLIKSQPASCILPCCKTANTDM